MRKRGYGDGFSLWSRGKAPAVCLGRQATTVGLPEKKLLIPLVDCAMMTTFQTGNRFFDRKGGATMANLMISLNRLSINLDRVQDLYLAWKAPLLKPDGR